MRQQNDTKRQGVQELIVQGLVVRLIFNEQANQAVPSLVREILKESWITRAIRSSWESERRVR